MSRKKLSKVRRKAHVSILGCVFLIILKLDFAKVDPLATPLWCPPPHHPPSINSHLSSTQQLKKKCFITRFSLVLQFSKSNCHFSIFSHFGHFDQLLRGAGTHGGPGEALYGIFPPLLIIPQVPYHRQFNLEMPSDSERAHIWFF